MYFNISAFEKIQLEAPYHALTNAGHISYVEMDGDPLKNLDAFEKIVRHMHDSGVGYGSINHPVDRDPVCGFNGVINDVCPGCGRAEDGQTFERIRRITGYLVGTLTASTTQSKPRKRTGSSTSFHRQTLLQFPAHCRVIPLARSVLSSYSSLPVAALCKTSHPRVAFGYAEAATSGMLSVDARRSAATTSDIAGAT